MSTWLANHAPVLTLTPPNVSATAGQVLQAANLFGATDAEDDPLTYYLYDATPAANSGHFVVNGTVDVGPDRYPGDPGASWRRPASSGRHRHLRRSSVLAYDGKAFSPWCRVPRQRGSANHAPVLTLSSTMFRRPPASAAGRKPVRRHRRRQRPADLLSYDATRRPTAATSWSTASCSPQASSTLLRRHSSHKPPSSPAPRKSPTTCTSWPTTARRSRARTTPHSMSSCEKPNT